MDSKSKDFEKSDNLAAENLCKAAEIAGVKRIIYLGGLGEDSPELSKHLKSRANVAQILKSGKTAVTEFRAAMIIGSGSASFEILRYLVDRLPIMITPKWVRTRSQPIAIRNVLTYLVNCLEASKTTGKTFDIGGIDVLTYQEIMEIYAEEAGLAKRLVIPVPVFTPKLSSYWIHFVTPVHSSIARPLAEGLRNETICQDETIKELIPQELLTVRQAISLALERMEEQKIESHWSDAGIVEHAEWAQQGDPSWAGGLIYLDQREIEIEATPEQIWQPIERIGGKTGWYFADWLWEARGLIDRIFGGIGLRRGRRNDFKISVGDSLDFWRVRTVIPGQKLSLCAEMKLPGKAILEFNIEEINPENPKQINPAKCRLTQKALFLPSGLSGILYWWLVSPLHEIVFNGMLTGIANATNRPICKPAGKSRRCS
jgi:uncharacterized protein YbjT (DUF2867 family)